MNKQRFNTMLIFIFCTTIMFMFLLSGCDELKIEFPKCGVSQNETGNTSMGYVSLPMCGGCLTYEWGCSSCLWPQKCVLSYGYGEEMSEATNGTEATVLVNCDNVNYGNSCFVCGGIKEHDYTGIIYGPDLMACYCGTTKANAEYILGYYDGCACAAKNEDNEFAEVGEFIQILTDLSDVMS